MSHETEPAFEDDDPSTVPEGTGDTWGPPLRKPVPASPPEVPMGLSEEIETLAAEWLKQAEEMRQHRGQRTREKRGHEVLEACAWAIQDRLAALRTRG